MRAIERCFRLKVGFLLVVMTAAAMPAAAAGPDEDREMTLHEFHEWDFYNNLGWESVQKNDFAAAARRFKTAISYARIGSRKDPRLLARSYADMAFVLHRQGRNAEAEPMAKWALKVREARFREGTEPMAQILYTVAMIEIDLEKYPEAERDFVRCVSNYESVYGASSPRLAPYLNDLAFFYMTQRKYAKAEPLYGRCLAFPEKFLPANDPDRIVSLFGMGNVYYLEGQDEKAEPFYKKALEQLDLRPTNPALHADLLENYAGLLRRTQRPAEADSLLERAKEVRALLKPKTVSARPPGPRGS